MLKTKADPLEDLRDSTYAAKWLPKGSDGKRIYPGATVRYMNSTWKVKMCGRKLVILSHRMWDDRTVYSSNCEVLG